MSLVKDFVFVLLMITQLPKSNGAPCILNSTSAIRHCIDGYPKCYAVFTDGMTWEEGQSKCQQWNGRAHLATPRSARENQIISEILQNYDCIQQNTASDGKVYINNKFWLGGTRENISDCATTFGWRLPSGGFWPMSYTNWAKTQPDCFLSDQSCSSMIKSPPEVFTQWDDLSCSFKQCPVCELVRFDWKV